MGLAIKSASCRPQQFEVAELEVLEGGTGAEAVLILPEDTEGKDEHGIVGIDRGEAMIAAFVDVDDEVTVRDPLRESSI